MSKIIRRFFAFISTVLILVPPSVLPTVVSASSIPSNAGEEAKLLQLTSQGHVLGFRDDGVTIASARHMLRVDFLNTPGVTPETDGKSEDVGGKAAPLGRVTYKNLWEGVTAVYEASGSSIAKSTYYLDDGDRSDRIRLGYNRPVQIDERGNLVVTFDHGTLTESAPVAWQEIKGQRKPVKVDYVIRGEHEVGFSLGEYTAGVPVVIDPDLTWNTFLGGTGTDNVYGIVVDGSGNVYVGGFSDVTWGTPIQAHVAANDAFVVKLDSSGNLVWNTFMGGVGTDWGLSIAVDSSGNVYLGGSSNATWGTPVRAYSAGFDAFAAKLNSSGTLLWNTFAGGAGDDYSNGIRLDGSGNVYLGGNSSATWGTPVRAYVLGTDAYAVKFDGSGNLVWNTFLGGTGADTGLSIAVTSAGEVYVSGNSPVDWGTPIRAYTAGTDAFVAKVDSIGNLVWNTFLGGSGVDHGIAIAVDTIGNVYLAGYGPTTWGTPVRAYTASNDAFIVKFNSGGTILWSTFLGGTASDSSRGIIIDSSGNTHIGGNTAATWGTPVRAYSAGTDSFAAKLDSNGNLIWNTFLGGSGGDQVRGMGVDSNGNTYVGGYSDATWGAPVRAYTLAQDGYAAKILNLVPVASAVAINGTRTVGQTLTGSYAYSDPESDAEGASTFRWLRNGVAISGATSITYALTGADAGTLISFEVTPVPAIGASGITAGSVAVLITGAGSSGGGPGGTVTVTPTGPNGSALSMTLHHVENLGNATVRVWINLNADPNTVRGYALSTDPTFMNANLENYQSLVSIVVPLVPDPVTIYGRYFSTSGHPSTLQTLVVDLLTGISSPITAHALVKLPDDGNPNTQQDSAVYYIGSDSKRHAFPNDKVYFTWYSNFSGVQTIKASQLAAIPLGKNITYKPGVKMVKFATDPKVYAVAKNGLLRWIKSEATAVSLYGTNWNSLIDDISDAFYTNYQFGTDINAPADYNPGVARASVNFPSDSLQP